MRAICSSGSNSTWRPVCARIRWCRPSTTTTARSARSRARRTRAIAATPFIFSSIYAWRAHLPSEIPALALAIQRFRQGPNEAAYLESLLRLILEGSSRDAAGFSSAALDIVSRITDLQIADTAIGVTGFTAMDALRTYLVAQLKAPRCADNVLGDS